MKVNGNEVNVELPTGKIYLFSFHNGRVIPSQDWIVISQDDSADGTKRSTMENTPSSNRGETSNPKGDDTPSSNQDGASGSNVNGPTHFTCSVDECREKTLHAEQSTERCTQLETIATEDPLAEELVRRLFDSVIRSDYSL